MNDDELEAMMRRGLRARASDADDTGRYVERVRAAARRRGRLRVGLVAAAVVAVVFPVAVIVTEGADDQSADRSADATIPTVPSPDVPAGWRVESYDGVQLRVPPDWGWGGVPTPGKPGDERVYHCGEGAFAWPGDDGTTRFAGNGGPGPYVGRAAYLMSDACTNLSAPTVPHVWLDSPLEVGVEDLGQGLERHTVRVDEGFNVTVADDDPERLKTILGSLETVGVDAHGCDAEVDAVPRPELTGGDPLTALSDVERASICAYRYMGASGQPLLGYSTALRGAAAQRMFDAIASTPADREQSCSTERYELDVVVLRFQGTQRDVDFLVTLNDLCEGRWQGDYWDGNVRRELTRSNVAPWVVDGVGLYLSGGQVGNAITSLYPRPQG